MPNVFGGSVTVQDGSLVIPVTVLGADGDSFNSNVTVNTGSNADTVRLRAVTVAGNTSINLGNDTSTLQDFAYLGQFTLFPLSSQVPAVFAGSVSITQGTGIASVRVATALDIGGDFNMSLGEGNNNLVGDSIQPGFNISGSENITCGNGDNNLGLNWRHVDGNINIKLGNSDALGGGNATFIAYVPAGSILYHSGNGTRSLGSHSSDRRTDLERPRGLRQQ